MHSIPFRFVSVGAALLGLLFLTGCGKSGPPLAPLAGQVTLNGQPVEGAAIVFASVEGGRLGQALTDANGRFDAWTFEPGDGVLLGEHRVAVSVVKIIGVEATEDGLEGTARGPIHMLSTLPAHYGDIKTSGITAHVEAGRNNFVDFALSSQ